jgi:hypothetical protein
MNELMACEPKGRADDWTEELRSLRRATREGVG